MEGGSCALQLWYQKIEPGTSQKGQWADQFDFHEAIHIVTWGGVANA